MARSNWGEWRPPAPRREPVTSLYLIFGCQPYSAATVCDDIHHGPIPEGSAACCARCHQSGIDDAKALRETAADKIRLRDWKPENGRDQWSEDITGIPAEEPTTYVPDEKLSRRERRSRRWGRNSVPAVPMDPARLDRMIERGTAQTM